MTDNQAPVPASVTSVATLEPIIEQANEYARQSRSDATKTAYKSDWKDFTAWCSHHSLDPLPAVPEVIAAYISDLASRLSTATIRRRMTSISQAHIVANFESPIGSPIVREVWKGIRRTKGTAPIQKDALLTDHLYRISKALPDTLIGVRDRAILLVGIAGGFRRSELVSIDIEHLTFTDDGLIIRLLRSKTDQDAAGVDVGIPYGSKVDTCPVRSLKAWLTAASIESGPLFRGVDRHGNLLPARLSDRGIARAVKRCCELIGLDPEKFAGHSLRSGLATNAAYNGAPAHAIAQQGRWASLEMVNRYIRRGGLFRDNAASHLGL
jgi:integrase